MAQTAQHSLRKLKLLYPFIFALGAVLIVPTHFFPPPFFMPLRFPHYLEMMGPFLGISWPLTFEIYHYVLYALILIGSLNVLGIIFLKFKNIAVFSSLIGLFLITPITLFFLFPFMKVNPQTSIIYGSYSVLLLIVDLLTFKALVRT